MGRAPDWSVMMRATSEPSASEIERSAGGGRNRLGTLRRASRSIDLGLATAATLFAHLPGTARATRVRANATTRALQLLPDSTLQGLAASSIGLGAGLYLGGLPRLVTAAAVTPAVIIGAAIVLRPAQPSAGSGTTA
jgi:hypothetical protein